jgi:hypothetical protein
MGSSRKSLKSAALQPLDNNSARLMKTWLGVGKEGPKQELPTKIESKV